MMRFNSIDLRNAAIEVQMEKSRCFRSRATTKVSEGNYSISQEAH
jgi:hypothetical protein